MISKIRRYSFIVLLIATSILKLQAQEQDQIHEVDLEGLKSFQHTTEVETHIYFYKGQINLKDNDILEGEICLNQEYENNTYAAILRIDDRSFYIPNEKITEVILEAKIDNNLIKTKFVSIDSGDKLYREVFKKDAELIVYDLLEKPFDGHDLNDIHILEHGNLVRLDDFWTSGPKKDLINYLNKRDHKKYKKRDFNSLKDLFAIF